MTRPSGSFIVTALGLSVFFRSSSQVFFHFVQFVAAIQFLVFREILLQPVQKGIGCGRIGERDERFWLVHFAQNGQAFIAQFVHSPRPTVINIHHPLPEAGAIQVFDGFAPIPLHGIVALAFGVRVHYQYAFVFLSRRREAVGITLLFFVSLEKPFQKGSGFFYSSFGFFVCPAFIADGEAFVGVVFL